MKGVHHFVESLTRGKEQTLCVLNGIVGDALEERITGLAIPMTLTTGNERLLLTRAAFRNAALPDSSRICILAHGNCGSHRGWGFKNNRSSNYGSLLQRDFGFTPFFLRYNSGLHISTNGKLLSNLLEKLIYCYPCKVQEVVLVGHSMGGLVFRSACHYGRKERRKWIQLIKKIFYLGTPHLGTHLEKLGKLTTTILKHIPNPITKAIVILGDLRSAGIKDLRHGYLIDEDWQNKNADNLFYGHQNTTPLLKTADHYFICGTLSKVDGSKMGRLFGDGLVHPASGTGRGLFTSSDIPFLNNHCKIISGISHRHLQRSTRVYEQIRDWCD